MSRLLVFAALVTLVLSGCTMAWRAIRYNVPSVTDHRLWEERPIRRADPVYPLHEAKDIGIPEPSDWAFGKWYKPGMTTEDLLAATGTVAFLVMRGDTIVYEHYLDGHDETTRFNGFSMAKVYLSALVGIALEERHIKSLDQSIGDYLPWCTDSTICKIKLRHLLQMTSGLRSSEGYLNPWATSSRLYYGRDMDRLVHQLRLQKPPGTRYDYQNINSQLLGLVLAKATGRPLATYLEEKIWQPLGMESDAGWSLHEGTDVEKAFCCLNARVRDFARFGLLYLNGGQWKGKQIVPAYWVAQPLHPDLREGAADHYQFAWYTTTSGDDYYAQGLLGQFTYVAPKTRTVIVRIGDDLHYKVPWYEYFRFIAGMGTKPDAVPFTRQELKPYAGEYVFGPTVEGDTTMAGRKVRIAATSKGLKVYSSFMPTFTAVPSGQHKFFCLDKARYLNFLPSPGGAIDSLLWERRGLAWKMGRSGQ